jgi:voltage-gated potassium channel Kch
MSKGIDQLSGHTIICGYGRLGTTLAKELHAAGQPFVAIDTLGGASSNIDGADGFLMIRGDATEEDVLERAGIARANVLATVMSDDATNVFVTLTAREKNPDLTIIARGENRRTESKLRSCGADTVVMATTIGATRITQLILRPTADELLNQLTNGSDSGDLGHIGLQFDDRLLRRHPRTGHTPPTPCRQTLGHLPRCRNGHLRPNTTTPGWGDHLMNSISRYFGSGQNSSATSASSASAWDRTASMRPRIVPAQYCM